jgi:4-amino-4-deoxy-L-arabinose transferase-like glycosyltransferase
MSRWILIAIIILAACLRLYRLDTVPPALFADEASIGYNAFTISRFGHDEFGQKLPVFFKAFGEYKGPVQIYTTVPFVWALGLNEWSTRLPSVLYGMLGVLVIYLLSKELFRQHSSGKLIALCSALLLAISPWHIHMSRISFEGLMPFVFFTTLGTYFFLKSSNNYKYLFAAVLAFTFALYSYFPARIFIPAYVLFLIPVGFRKATLYYKYLIMSAVFGLVLIVPLFKSFLNGSGLSRWEQVSIFNNPPTYESVWTHIVKNYLSHFSVEFLFTKGDIDMPGQFITRHSVRGIGQLYLIQAPLILFGLIWLRNNRKAAWIILIWLVIYPLGSALTQDKNAQATRSVIGVIPLQILSACGIAFMYDYFQKVKFKKTIIGLMFGLTIILLFKFVDLYFNKYTTYSSDYWGWQYGQKQIVQYFVSQSPKYDVMYSSGEANGADIFFKYFDPYNRCLGKCRLGDISTNANLDSNTQKQLFSVGADKLDKVNFKQIMHVIYYPNGKPAFYIGEVQ